MLNPMQRFLTASFFACSASVTLADSMNNTAHLKLTIDKISEVRGTLMIALYNSKETYQKSDSNVAVSALKIKVTDKSQVIDLGELPQGDYWISFYHDENDNNKLDKNILGIPKEGYGFSNNGGQFGQPSAEDARVHIEKDTDITIHER